MKKMETLRLKSAAVMGSGGGFSQLRTAQSGSSHSEVTSIWVTDPHRTHLPGPAWLDTPLPATPPEAGLHPDQWR